LAAYAAEVAEVAESAEAAEAAEAVQAAEAVETAEAAEAAGGQLPPALFTTCTTPRWTRDERLRVACRHSPKFARLTWYGMGRGKCGCVAWYQNGDTCHVKEASISGRRHDRASPAIVGKHPSGAHHFFGRHACKLPLSMLPLSSHPLAALGTHACQSMHHTPNQATTN
jgi:hypothetical protein